jgi:hypothetical protein
VLNNLIIVQKANVVLNENDKESGWRLAVGC